MPPIRFNSITRGRECPECGHVYRDWYRASLNLGRDDFDDAYIEEASTVTCPGCGHKVAISNLIVEEGNCWVLYDDDEENNGEQG